MNLQGKKTFDASNGSLKNISWIYWPLKFSCICLSFTTVSCFCLSPHSTFIFPFSLLCILSFIPCISFYCYFIMGAQIKKVLPITGSPLSINYLILTFPSFISVSQITCNTSIICIDVSVIFLMRNKLN